MSRPSGLATFIGLLLVLLTVLAFLQHRWIMQLGEAQRTELEGGLLASASALGHAFGSEIMRAINANRAAGSMIRENEWRSYADRYIAWQDGTDFPAIVDDVLLVDYKLERLRLRRWNPASLDYEPAEWPDQLESWRPLLERALKQGRLVTPLLGGNQSTFIAFAAVLGRRPATDHQDTAPALLGFNIVLFDLDYIREHVLPTLTARFLSTAAGNRYRVIITDERGVDGVVYASDPKAPIDLDQGVAVALIQPLRRDEQVAFPRLTLHVQHSPGVVQQAVTELQWRNLMVGLGTLGLLFAGIVLFAASSRRAQRLAREQVEVAAGVSHELRTPIAVIRLAAQNLSQDVVSGERIKYYGQLIEAEANRLGEVVENALLYAGTTSGRTGAARAPVAPAEVIDAAVEAVARSTPIPRLERTIAPDLPLVIGDGAALQSALENLISNAIKYGGPEGWIGIRAEATTGRRPEVRITVEDSGPGISNEDRPHIFKPFYRGTATASRHQRGSGLGLALVAQIAAAHRGRVSAANRPGGGSAFTIALPALRRDDRHARFAAGAHLPQAAPDVRP